MTLNEFREQFDGMPVEEHELARTVVDNLNAGDLFDAADAYLHARAVFLDELDNAEVELG